MHTGDLATMDAGGYVSVAGPVKGVIIRGGRTSTARGRGGAADLCGCGGCPVIGVPDDFYGEQVMAWVRPRDG